MLAMAVAALGGRWQIEVRLGFRARPAILHGQPAVRFAGVFRAVSG